MLEITVRHALFDTNYPFTDFNPPATFIFWHDEVSLAYSNYFICFLVKQSDRSKWISSSGEVKIPAQL